MDQVFGFLQMLQGSHIFEILLVAAGLLILIDYIFPTDVPAHIGYLCIALAVFFRVSGSFWSTELTGEPQHQPMNQFFVNVGIGLAVWIVLGILHRLIFRRFLENAPGTEGYEAAQAEAG